MQIKKNESALTYFIDMVNKTPDQSVPNIQKGLELIRDWVQIASHAGTAHYVIDDAMTPTLAETSNETIFMLHECGLLHLPHKYMLIEFAQINDFGMRDIFFSYCYEQDDEIRILSQIFIHRNGMTGYDIPVAPPGIGFNWGGEVAAIDGVLSIKIPQQTSVACEQVRMLVVTTIRIIAGLLSYNKQLRPVKSERKLSKHEKVTLKRKGSHSYTKIHLGYVEDSGGRQIMGEPCGTKRMHVRRGHIRRQHHGVGNQEIKKIFIAPVIVNYAQEGFLDAPLRVVSV